jgi:preprotein translocase subunit YajC
MAVQNGVLTTSTGAPATPAASPNPIVSFVPIVVVCGILYLLVIRPQQKQVKDHKRLVDSLKSGDRVLTQGGIYGTVVNLKGNIVLLKIADNVKVEVSRSAISQVQTDTENSPSVPTQGQLVS